MKEPFHWRGQYVDVPHARVVEQLISMKLAQSPDLNSRFLLALRPKQRPLWAKRYEEMIHSVLLGSLVLLTFPWLLAAMVLEPILTVIAFSAVYALTPQLARVFSQTAINGVQRGHNSTAIADSFIHENIAQYTVGTPQFEGRIAEHLKKAGLLGQLMLFFARPRHAINFVSIGFGIVASVSGAIVGMSLLGLMSMSPLLTLVLGGFSALCWASSIFSARAPAPTSLMPEPVSSGGLRNNFFSGRELRQEHDIRPSRSLEDMYRAAGVPS